MKAALYQFKKKMTPLLMAFLFLGTQVIYPVLTSGVARAAAGASLEQCRNGSVTSPVDCAGAAWAAGNAGASNAHYAEGDAIPYRLLMTGLSSGSHSVTIEWDTLKSGVHAIDYATTYNYSETTANPCSGVVGCDSPTTFPIPVDPNAVNQVPGVFTLFDGTITSVSGYSVSGADASTRITINFTTTSETPVLAWAGHIASQIDWGFGNSAGAVSGSPYHTRLIDLDGSGGNQDRSLSASAILPTPIITTTATPSTVTVGQTVTDTATLAGPSTNSPSVTGTVAFYVCGPSATNPTCTTGGSQVGSAVTISSNQAVSSPYTVNTEGKYCFRAEYTPFADSSYSPQNHTNLTTECFTANPAPSSITIIKDAKPNRAQDFSFTATGVSETAFLLDDDTNATLSNTKAFNNLTAGVYTFTEASTSGWDLKNIVCSGGTTEVNGSTVTITLGAGQNVSCTYTNVKRGTVTVNKVTNPVGDTTPFPVTISGSGNISGTTTRNVTTTTPVVYDVSEGSYSVSEQVPAGWTQTSNTCTTDNLTITVTDSTTDAQLAKSCTITNTKYSKITVIKDAVPNNSQDFTFTASGTGVSGFILDDDSDAIVPNQVVFSNLLPGAFSFSELEQAGWDLTGIVCTGTGVSYQVNSATVNVALSAGQDITCTFTNTKRASVSGQKFEDVNGNGIWDAGEPTLNDWNIWIDIDGDGLFNPDVDESMLTTGDGMYLFTNILPGSYSVYEMLQDGWTQTAFPSEFTLDAGEDQTGVNLGNFQHGSISGYKFNDVNGNAAKDTDESKISDWTINLFIDNDDPDTIFNNLYSTVKTDASGNFSFTNLPKGQYYLCEAQVSGWTQTLPANNGCYMIEIDISGESNTDKIFGNQGRATITVKKDVDTNDDGVVDISNADNWTWDLTPAVTGLESYTDVATGTTKAVGVGTYTIHEDQKTNYHFVSLVCGTQKVTQAETSTVAVQPGQNLVCTYTNARDMGTLKVVKQLYPSTDPGKFDLLINDEVKASAVSDEGDTGVVSVPTGTYTVSETAGDEATNLDDYIANISGDCSVDGSVTVATGENKVCTITNTKKAKLTVVKQTWPDEDPQDFDFEVNKLPAEEILNEDLSLDAPSLLEDMSNVRDFTLDTDKTSETPGEEVIDGLTPGAYSVEELANEGWDLQSLTCYNTKNKSLITELVDPYVELDLAPGADVTCIYVNAKRSKITIVKDAGPDSSQAFSFSHNIDEDGEFQLIDDGTNMLNKKTFDNVRSDYYGRYYGITEQDLDGWRLADFSCDNWDYEEVSRFIAPLSIEQRSEYQNSIYVYPGEEVTCTFTNEQTVLFLEKSNNRPNPTTVGDQVTYTLEVSIPEGAADLNEVVVTDLPPKNFRYVHGSWTAFSSVRGDLKLAGITTEPTYGSPGQWQLGRMVDGEVVTLTYLADILEVVSPGTYPDIAFANGFTDDEEIVYDNLSVTNTPFVATSVTVNKPIPVVVVNKLVNTGNNSALFIVIPLLMILSTILGFQATRRYSVKGGK